MLLLRTAEQAQGRKCILPQVQGKGGGKLGTLVLAFGSSGSRHEVEG